MLDELAPMQAQKVLEQGVLITPLGSPVSRPLISQDCEGGAGEGPCRRKSGGEDRN